MNMKMGSIYQILALVYIVFHGLQAMANAPDLIKLQSAVAKGAGKYQYPLRLQCVVYHFSSSAGASF